MQNKPAMNPDSQFSTYFQMIIPGLMVGCVLRAIMLLTQMPQKTFFTLVILMLDVVGMVSKIKTLKILTPKNLPVIVLKFDQDGFTIEQFQMKKYGGL